MRALPGRRGKLDERPRHTFMKRELRLLHAVAFAAARRAREPDVRREREEDREIGNEPLGRDGVGLPERFGREPAPHALIRIR